MKYKIVISQVRAGQEESSYPTFDTVYEQSFGELDVPSIVGTLNTTQYIEEFSIPNRRVA